MKFPRKAWMPFSITPQQNLLNHLFYRRFLKLRATGVKARLASFQAALYEDECRKKYNLIEETKRLRLNMNEWESYRNMGWREKKKFEREMGVVLY